MSSASGSDVTPRIASRCRCRQVCGQYSSAAAAAAADDDDDDDAVTLQLVGWALFNASNLYVCQHTVHREASRQLADGESVNQWLLFLYM